MLRIVGLHHKCASGWISRNIRYLASQSGTKSKSFNVIESVSGYNDLAIVANCGYREYFHDKEFNITKGIHVIRDPRDIIVSAYFSHKFSHPTTYWPELIEQRKLLNSVSLEEGLLSELNFCKPFLEDMRSWNRFDERFKTCKYKDIFENPIGFLSAAIKHLDIIWPGGIYAQRTVETNSFERLSNGRKRGEENKKSHYRKGISGDYLNYFTPKVTQEFNERYGDLLIQYNYE